MEKENKTKEIKEEKNENKENQNNNDENELNMGFFKKVWYSIVKIEKYPNMSA